MTAHHAPLHGQASIPHAEVGIARVVHPSLCTMSSWGSGYDPLANRSTTAVSAEASALAHSVSSCQRAYPRSSSVHVLTCAVSFSVDAIDVQLFARRGLNHLTIYPSNY